MHKAPILVVSASAGTGHVRAGEAIATALNAAGCAAYHVDVLSLAPRWVRRFYGGGFELLAKRAPGVWRRLYENADGEVDARTRLGQLAWRILFREFRRELESRPWRACVCTHFLPPQLAAHRSRVPFAIVMTDFEVHRYWVQPAVRQYFVPTTAAADELRRRLPDAQVVHAGIPIGPEFSRLPYWATERRRLGLAVDRPVLLITGGGLGLGVEVAVHTALRAEVHGLQVVAVCGRDENACHRLSSLGVPAERLLVIGYTREMHALMTAADAIVTKPGGLTTSEALAVGRPLILTRPIPGHEAANAAFLVRAGAALSAAAPASLKGVVERFFGEPGLPLDLAHAARAIGRPYAAAEIAAELRRHYVARNVA